MENIFVEFLPPWIETGCQPAFYDKESGTCLQQTARMYDRVNMLVRMFNKLSKETTESFNSLHDYVYDYFDNLDVQEEIDHKLDEMVEDGTLASILNDEVFKGLDVADNYRTTVTKMTDNIRTLEYYITRLTPNPQKVDHIELKGKFSRDTLAESSVEGETKGMFEFSKEINSTFASNADSLGSLAHAVVIRDGVVLQATSDSNHTICGFDDKGELKVYSHLATSDQPVEDGVINTWGCSILINDGTIDTDDWSDVNVDTKDEQHPRTIMLQEYDSKDVVFLHIEGRKPSSVGVTFSEACALIQEILPNTKNAVIFGGGGDSQLMVKGRMINDSNDLQLRPLYDIIYLDPNLVDYTNDASKEIANARNLDVTIHDMLKDRINLTDNLKFANRILQAEVSATSSGAIHLVCNVDYNTVLEDGDCFVVKFPDLSEYDAGSALRFTIHYATELHSPYLRYENGTATQPMELSGTIRLCYFDTDHYVIKDEESIIKFISSNTETDLDNYKTTGSYYSDNFTNTPTTPFNDSEKGFLRVYQMPKHDIVVQEYVTYTDRVYTRTFNSTWGRWELVNSTKPCWKNGVDLDNIGGYNITAYGNSLVNKPADSANGWIINLGGREDGYNAQIYIERDTSGGDKGRIFLRLQENGTWKNWKQIAFTV